MASPAVRQALLIVASAILGAGLGAREPAGRQDAAISPPAATADLVVFDRNGRFVDDVKATDLVATIDGVRRPVLWVRRVSRGPGAIAEASSRQARAAADAIFAAEAARTVLVVIDQASILRGDEAEVVRAATLFLDRLGLNDRVAVVGVPAAAGTLVNLTSERAEARAVLSRVTGLLAPAVTARVEPASGEPVEQRRMTGIEPDRPMPVDPGLSAAPLPDTLAALRSVIETLRQLPGRKVVAVFSAGLPASAKAQVEEAAYAAVEARTVVYGFGARASNSGGSRFSTTAPLERLAGATGGAFAPLGRNAARVVDRAADELAACYVVGLEPASPDRPGARRALRLETTRKGLTVRAGAWLAAAPDAGDQVIAPPGPAATGTPAAAVVNDEGVPPPVRDAQDGELQVALARLFDYADGYERQYSMLVAEEDYRQSASAGGVRLRSDLLLVRPEQGSEWASFRDVYEVDGKPVRDREERLRRLFLEATPDAMARLQAIEGESARYNVGWVERTANVPLLPLSFLRPANRGRFEYELAGRDNGRGVEAWRVRYRERARPTLIGDRQHNDLPVSGWFLVETLTGAVVETRMEARRGDARAEIVVRYRSDPALGLWVPAEMRESYSQPDSGGSGRQGLVRRALVEGRATYSNFRRFQVQTDEAIKPPK